MMNSDLRFLKLEAQSCPPEHANLSDTETSLDQVRSEGRRQWNMDMEVEYQYETFNGLPVYYSGDMYDSEDTEECNPVEMAHAAYVEDYYFDVPEGMELMTYNRRLPDGGDDWGVNEVDMVPMCRTVSGVARYELDESSDTSRTDTAELEESDIEDCDLWTDLWEDGDCPVFIAGSIVDNGLFPAKQCRATRMWPLWVIFMMGILVTLAVIQIWAPERSSDGRRGMTHVRGNLGAHLRIFRRTQLELFRWCLGGMIANFRNGTFVILELTLSTIDIDM